MIVVNHTTGVPGINPIYLALLTGVITAAGAIFGVWLTQRRTVHLAYQQRSDTRKEAVRRLVGELVDAARDWGNAAEIQAIVMSKGNQDDMMEFVDTDSGIRLRELVAIKKRASLEARMRIAEEGLLKALERVWAQEAVYVEAMSSVYPSRRRPSGDAVVPLVHDVIREARVYQLTLDAVEVEAGALLREPMELSLPPLLATRALRKGLRRVKKFVGKVRRGAADR